jgi:hypothetical protein
MLRRGSLRRADRRCALSLMRQYCRADKIALCCTRLPPSAARRFETPLRLALAMGRWSVAHGSALPSAMAAGFGELTTQEWMRADLNSGRAPQRASASAGKAPNACVQRGRERQSDVHEKLASRPPLQRLVGRPWQHFISLSA